MPQVRRARADPLVAVIVIIMIVALIVIIWSLWRSSMRGIEPSETAESTALSFEGFDDTIEGDLSVSENWQKCNSREMLFTVVECLIF